MHRECPSAAALSLNVGTKMVILAKMARAAGCNWMRLEFRLQKEQQERSVSWSSVLIYFLDCLSFD